jgi:mono/diheme cytochrome c family protein
MALLQQLVSSVLTPFPSRDSTMMRSMLLGVLVSGMLTLGATAAGAQEDTTITPAEPASALVTDEVTDQGRQIFRGKGTCFACHGKKLQGGPIAPSLLGPKFRNGDGSFEMILRIVRGGVPGTVMVSHPGGISDAQTIQVATYVFAVGHGLATP